ncbi:MAG: carbohydrate binding domain-containing protein, partial [Candidatus Brocadiae bacterium]|nr:carbohydrate binding domain-containing protein [Candidatus Brocadiia bacterium]
MNLVKNGDFSQVSEGKPVGWVAAGDPESVTQELVTAYEGDNPYAKLTCTRCEGGGGSSHAMIAQVGQVHVQKGRRYELSFRVRAEGMQGRTVNVALTDTANWQPCGLSRGVRVGESWRDYRLQFEALRSVGEAGRLQFWFTEPGTLYLADVRIGETEPTDVVFTHVVPEGAGKNLLPNGSFELGMIGWAAAGESIAWGNLDRVHGRIESSGATHGSRFLRVPLGGKEGPVLYWDYYDPVVRPLRMMLAANLGWIRVEPGQPYTLSCDMRASVEGATAILGVRTQDPRGSDMPRGGDLRHKVQLAKQWQRYSFTFRPRNRYVYVTVGPDLDEEMRVDVDVDAVQLEKGERATGFGPHSQVEAGIEPSEPGGVFTEGEPASLRLRAYNYGTSPAVVRATFEVTDFFDAPVELAPVSLDVPAGGLAERDVPLPADWKGYYCLHATYDGEGTTGTQSLRLAVVPPRSETDSIVGINHAFPDAFLIDQAKKAGVTWYRDWSLKWHDLEPSPGEYHWEVGDPQVDRVVAEGVHLMALMPPYPSTKWNTTGSPEDASSRSPGELAWAPSDPQKLGDFIEKAVAHYQDRVPVWEFLNEPIY